MAEIMAAAGLTHGGFYRHFASKDELVTEAIALSRKDYLADTLSAADQGPEALLKHFQKYVTPNYRDEVGTGCPLAANGSEIVRSDAKTRHNATEALRLWFDKTAPYMRSPDDAGKADMAISVVTNMIGALTMARMVDDPELSDKILAATRRATHKRVRPVFCETRGRLNPASAEATKEARKIEGAMNLPDLPSLERVRKRLSPIRSRLRVPPNSLHTRERATALRPLAPALPAARRVARSVAVPSHERRARRTAAPF